VEIRRDGDPLWRDVRLDHGYNETTGQLTLAVPAGVHTLEARAVAGVASVDGTPWTHVWHVDQTPPVLSFVSPKPSAWSDEPRGTARFLVRSSKDVAVFESRLWSSDLGARVASNGYVLPAKTVSPPQQGTPAVIGENTNCKPLHIPVRS
jgi:hypothetical protein